MQQYASVRVLECTNLDLDRIRFILDPEVPPARSASGEVDSSSESAHLLMYFSGA